MSEIYREIVDHSEASIQQKALEFAAAAKQWGKDEWLLEKVQTLEIMREHFTRIALENNGQIPLESACKVIDGILEAEL